MRNKCTCHVYGQIHQYRIQIETEEIKLDAQSSKTKLQKIQRWQRVEKQKTLKLKTQVFQLKQPHQKTRVPTHDRENRARHPWTPQCKESPLLPDLLHLQLALTPTTCECGYQLFEPRGAWAKGATDAMVHTRRLHARPLPPGDRWRPAIWYRPRNCGNQPAQTATPCPVDWGLTANARRHCPGSTQCQKISPAPVGQKTRITQRQELFYAIQPSRSNDQAPRPLLQWRTCHSEPSSVQRRTCPSMDWPTATTSRSGPPKVKYGPSRPRRTVRAAQLNEQALSMRGDSCCHLALEWAPSHAIQLLRSDTRTSADALTVSGNWELRFRWNPSKPQDSNSYYKTPMPESTVWSR